MAPVPSGLRARVAVAAVALAVVATVAGVWFGPSADEPPPSDDRLISSLYQHPDTPVERLLNARDGQIFATLSVDPLARHTDLLWGGPKEEAYRYQRPGYGWLGWLASGGQAGAVPYALVGVTLLSVAALVFVLATALQRAGAPPAFALVALITPGVMADVAFVGPEALGCAFALGGLLLVRRRPDVPWAAVALFAAAALLRESLIAFPAVLALLALVDRRPAVTMRLATAALPYVAWVVQLRVRVGAWPTGAAVDGRLTLVPFQGAAESFAGWGPVTLSILAVLAIVTVAGLALSRDRQVRALIGAHVAFAAVLGPAVWARAEDVGRVLLPLGVLGIWAWAAARAERMAEMPDMATVNADAGRDSVTVPA